MREQEFGRAAVEIVLRAEVPDRDRRVLDVPSWPAFSPGTVPGRLPGFLRPPEDEVRGMPLSLLDLDPGPRPEFLDLLPAELAPPREGRRVEVHALVLGDVGVSFPDEALDLFHDLVDIVRREGVHVDRRAVESVHHIEVFREILRDDVVPRTTRRLHSRDDPVLDVRDVLQIEDAVSLVAQVACHDVECDVGLRVPHVGLVLRRESADEEGDALAVERDERLLLPGEAVVDAEGHFFVRMRAAGIKVLSTAPTHIAGCGRRLSRRASF